MNLTALKYVTFFLTVLFVPSFIVAQSIFERPVVIDMEDGLPSNYITAIAKDNDGFMWFGTDNGLCRWDGISAKVFRHDSSDTNSIASDFIEPDALLWDDEQNKLLIGTSEGLSIYNPISGRFRNYYPGMSDSIPSGNRISAIIKDKEGIIWIATDNGFARYNASTDNFINYYYQGSFDGQPVFDKVMANITLDICQDFKNDSIFWIGTRSGLLKFNKYTQEIRWFYFNYFPRNIESNINVFRSVCPHPNGKLYLGTWTSGMTIFCTETETFIKNFRPSSVPEKKNIHDGTFPPIKIKSEFEIWLPTVLGLSVFDTEKDTIKILTSFKNPAGKKYPLWLNLIDEKNRLWCGSRYGVYMFDGQNRQFDNYFFKPSGNFKSYITWDIFEDTKTGLIFLAIQGADGLHYYNPAKQQFGFLQVPADPMSENTINSIFQSNDGTVWIVCPYGLYKLSSDRKKLLPFDLYYDSYPWFKEMVEDKNGNIWISSLYYGLQKVNILSAKLEEVKNWRDYFKTDKNAPEMIHLIVDRDNRIWFSRRYGGYGFYDIEADSAHYFFIHDSIGDRFYNLNCFAHGKDNIIWAGDGNKGLGFIDPDFPEKGVQSKCSTINGLQSNNVHNVKPDDKDRIWMLTEAGLEMFDPATGETALYNSNDGMVTFDTFANRNSYIPGSLEKLSSGRMVIGYRRGLGFFYPDSLVTNKEIPIPYLTSVKVFEKEISSDTTLYYSHQIDLDYHQNFLTFEYSAIALTIGSDIRFFHQLEGVDRDWVQSSRCFASYSNLAPGTYAFRVKAQSGYQLWSEKPMIFKIAIHPPWWKTWWAYALYILAIGGTLFGFYRFQLNRHLVQREASRLKELDEIKSQLYANITHEFRTPLTVITGMADEIKSYLKPGEQTRLGEFLDMIKRNAGNLLHLVSQMLDLSKLESGKLELKPIQADVVPYLQYITESFQSFAESKGIKLVFYNETETVFMDYDPDKLFTIISNLLSNAIKFTHKGGKVICHLQTSGKSHPENLILKIKDTGIGIPADMLPNIFNRFFQVDSTSTRKDEGTGIGLSLAKELVELMKGTITVKSQQGKGSEFTVCLPITRTAQKQVSKFDGKQADSEISDKWPGGLPAEPVITELPGSDTFVAPDYPLTLIVEDNEDVAKYIAVCLGEDYKIHHAKDGQEGINKALGLIPDIIICDVMMPEKDGFEVCSFLKQDERTSHIPIIMLTAKATREDRLEGLKSGADAYLTKPFDKKELLIRMDKMVGLRKHLLEKFSDRKYKLKSSLSPDNIEDLFLQKAINFIENNIDDSDFGTLQLARSIGMSESQIYRKLKALTGKSTALFIRSMRLQKAKELLKTTTLNVSE
ncbi:MAG: response regulator, partial [Bacteroidetes bacterium]|nr:response regulator [Bacteroidota bacterium]